MRELGREEVRKERRKGGRERGKKEGREGGRKEGRSSLLAINSITIYLSYDIINFFLTFDIFS